MNQSDRFIKSKCKGCGKEINLFQVYDTRTSEYVTVSLPFCWECRNKNIERGVAIDD